MQRSSALVWLRFPGRYYFWGSLLIVAFSAFVISMQITDRHGFANSELRESVLDRWGAPIDQPAPSVRYVQSGSVFNTLHTLALDRQEIVLDAAMNYRKRGLVYFSGFEFEFRGRYTASNPESHDIDVVFVFPIHAERNRILLSDLYFAVNGEPSEIALADGTDKLVWTGRLAPDEAADFEIAFTGRGLDLFTYRMDPAVPARNFSLHIRIDGGRTSISQGGRQRPGNLVTVDIITCAVRSHPYGGNNGNKLVAVQQFNDTGIDLDHPPHQSQLRPFVPIRKHFLRLD